MFLEVCTTVTIGGLIILRLKMDEVSRYCPLRFLIIEGVRWGQWRLLNYGQASVVKARSMPLLLLVQAVRILQNWRPLMTSLRIERHCPIGDGKLGRGTV